MRRTGAAILAVVIGAVGMVIATNWDRIVGDRELMQIEVVMKPFPTPDSLPSLSCGAHPSEG